MQGGVSQALWGHSWPLGNTGLMPHAPSSLRNRWPRWGLESGSHLGLYTVRATAWSPFSMEQPHSPSAVSGGEGMLVEGDHQAVASPPAQRRHPSQLPTDSNPTVLTHPFPPCPAALMALT